MFPREPRSLHDPRNLDRARFTRNSPLSVSFQNLVAWQIVPTIRSVSLERTCSLLFDWFIVAPRRLRFRYHGLPIENSIYSRYQCLRSYVFSVFASVDVTSTTLSPYVDFLSFELFNFPNSSHIESINSAKRVQSNIRCFLKKCSHIASDRWEQTNKIFLKTLEKFQIQQNL